MNDVRIDGKITKNGVKVSYTPTGLAVATFTIGKSRKKKGTEDWETEFFDVRAFDKVAEGAAPLTGKVLVEGYLKQQRWEKDGVKKSAVLVIANSIIPDGPKQEAPPPSDGDIPF